MPVNPAIWGNNLESETKSFYKDVDAMIKTKDQAPDIWQTFVNKSAAGLTVIPPFSFASTLSQPAFAPLSFSPSELPIVTAQKIASAWASWFAAITWTFTPAPLPPFTLSIASAVSNPALIPAAQAALFAGLLAQFAIIPPDPVSAALKYQAIGTLFYTATITPGVLISGLVIGTPPVPLAAPFPAL